MIKRKIYILFAFSFLAQSVLAQSISHGIVTQITANRFALAHHLGYELNWNKNKLGAYIGYNPDRLIRFNHGATFVKCNFSRKLISEEKLTILLAFDAVGNFRAYPTNQNLTIASAYGGYALSYGKSWQFVQSLSLGLSQFIVPDVKGFVTHDFLVMFGLKYQIGHE